MKSRTDQSVFSFVLTIVVFGLLIAAVYFTYGTDKFILTTLLVIVILGVSLFYAPLSISADEREVNINSSLRIHTIPMDRIVSVERFQPTMGSLRICGSGGFMGYWGMFSEKDTGKYMAYYGRPSDCFMICLDNGDKYVLGCKDPDAMVDFINSHIKHDGIA